MGLCAVVEAGGVEMVLTSQRVMPFDAEHLTAVGIEPAERRIVVVKSAIAWRAGFGEVAAQAIGVDTPGHARAAASRRFRTAGRLDRSCRWTMPFDYVRLGDVASRSQSQAAEVAMSVRAGVDTGGTFTDLVLFDEETRRDPDVEGARRRRASPRAPSSTRSPRPGSTRTTSRTSSTARPSRRTRSSSARAPTSRC